MPMTYETDRGVFFDPNEVQIDKCFKCATPTTRQSRRSIATLVRGSHGRLAVRSMTGALVLCERCDRRWDVAIAIGYLSFVMPFALPFLAAKIDSKATPVSGTWYAVSVVAGLVACIAMYVYAVKQSIRVRSIDDDGLIGIDGIHPDVRFDIVALGVADPTSRRH
jgi:hypothetical protein